MFDDAIMTLKRFENRCRNRDRRVGFRSRKCIQACHRSNKGVTCDYKNDSKTPAMLFNTYTLFGSVEIYEKLRSEGVEMERVVAT
ncbi:hypothetical protein CR513_52933, partial [Mucuna pruriens]